MNVRELIAVLQKLPPDMDVVMSADPSRPRARPFGRGSGERASGAPVPIGPHGRRREAGCRHSGASGDACPGARSEGQAQRGHGAQGRAFGACQRRRRLGRGVAPRGSLSALRAPLNIDSISLCEGRPSASSRPFCCGAA